MAVRRDFSKIKISEVPRSFMGEKSSRSVLSFKALGEEKKQFQTLEEYAPLFYKLGFSFLLLIKDGNPSQHLSTGGGEGP